MAQPRHPELDRMTYVEFGSKCRLEKHDLDTELHPLQVLENEYPGRPRMRIRFYNPTHVGVCRIQMVYRRHGDVFYLRALLLHRSARDWIDRRTIDGVDHATYQEAARAVGLFDNRDGGIMAFEELLESGAAPAQLRRIFAVLAVEGSPPLIIWETHEDSLCADIVDRMLQVTENPPPDLVRNELLQKLLQGPGKSLSEIGLPEPAEQQQEVDAERLRWGGDPSNLCAFKDGLTAEQRSIYDRIMHVATLESPPPIHVDGREGCRLASYEWIVGSGAGFGDGLMARRIFCRGKSKNGQNYICRYGRGLFSRHISPSKQRKLNELLRSHSTPLDPSQFKSTAASCLQDAAVYGKEIARLQRECSPTDLSSYIAKLYDICAALNIYAERCRSLFSPIRCVPPEILLEILELLSPAREKFSNTSSVPASGSVLALAERDRHAVALDQDGSRSRRVVAMRYSVVQASP
ncbi:hypothetical protein B0H13DRAFT_1855242 [Mycena leptocephala]|nr:hypothetical protein B0H13DRAFT_1855242 [Mycena leptocephala]